MNKTIIAIIVVAIIALGGYFLLRSPQSPTSSSNIAPQQPPSQESSQTSSVPTTEAPVSPAPVTQQAPSADQNVVTYADSGYSPSTLRVKVGTTVTFKNSSSQSMWTASGVHPTHTTYPTTGGCLGSTFDACKGVQLGSSWSFKFDIAGSWKYHNHLNPSTTGTIVVE